MNLFNSGRFLIALVLLCACEPVVAHGQGPATGEVEAQTPARLLQHGRYRSFIKTPLRDLVAVDNFRLVDNWPAFMQYHDRYVTGRESSNSGALDFYADKIDVNHCSEDMSKTNTKVSSKVAQQTLPAIVNRCHNMLAQLFRIDPYDNVSYYREIIDYWLDNGTLEQANSLQARMGRQGRDYAYALSSNVAKMMAHFSLYHRLYGYSENKKSEVIEVFERFAVTYDYYRPFQAGGPYHSELCNLRRPTVPKGTNDHCGSFNTRMAVGATLMGLEFGSQIIFDKGVLHVEIMLATFDDQSMYTSQIWRHDALSYADQIGPAIDQLDYALEKAFGIDFVNMKTVHGTTPGRVYQQLWTVANNPSLLKPYMNYRRRSDPHYYDSVPDYGGQNMYSVINQIELGELAPEFVWQAFTERRYILTVPALAREFQPVLWRKWKPQMSVEDFDFGQRITGFSPLILREGTARY